jgi:hypothetical protein
MTFRSSLLSLVLSGSAAALGCQQAPSVDTADGAIEFVVQPAQALAQRAPSGSFDVRGIDSSMHVRVGVGSSRTLRLKLPSGSYAVAWEPTVSFEPGSPGPALPAEPAQSPQVVLVTAGGIASVDVVATASAGRTTALDTLPDAADVGLEVARR